MFKFKVIEYRNKTNKIIQSLNNGLENKRNIILKKLLQKLKNFLKQKKVWISKNVDILEKLVKKDKSAEYELEIYKKVLKYYDDYVEAICIDDNTLKVKSGKIEDVNVIWIGKVLEYGVGRVPPLPHWRILLRL